MSRTKASPKASRDQLLRQKLESLYIRRAALDQLIDKLKAYESLKGHSVDPPTPAIGCPLGSPLVR